MKTLLFALVLLVLAMDASGQGLMGKLKQKAEAAASKALEKKVREKIGLPPAGSTPSGPGNSGPSNKGGAGLVTTPPDVNKNLVEAETAFKAASYGESRYSIQQAMLGVEMEIGNKILKSLPQTVSSLPKINEEDQVTSTGWGWVGLTIKRVYRKDDVQLTALIANNSAWMSALNLYFANTGYAQQTNGEQNWKQTKVKGYRAIIEYSESSGYKLSVSIGQSTLVLFEAINFETEQQVMDAANAFDFDSIKNTLGEK